MGRAELSAALHWLPDLFLDPVPARETAAGAKVWLLSSDPSKGPSCQGVILPSPVPGLPGQVIKMWYWFQGPLRKLGAVGLPFSLHLPSLQLALTA